MQALSARLQRLAKLDTTVFAEIKDDPAALVPSVIVAVAATFIFGIGGWIWWWLADFGDTGKMFLQSAILGTVFSLALWVVWVLVVYAILAQVFHEEADIQQLVRVMGLALAPLAIGVLMFIPKVDLGIALTAVALTFGLTNIAIRNVTPADPARVLVANAAGFAVWAIILSVLVGSSNWLAPGIFAFHGASETLRDLASNLGRVGSLF